MLRITKSFASRKLARIGLFTALLGMAAALSQFEALAVKSDSEVKVSAKATKPDASGKQVITVTMDINEGWYIYANPVKNKEMLNQQTILNIEGIAPEKVEVRYPSGKEKSSELGIHNIYQGKVAIQAAVQRSSDDAALEVGVTFMACHEKGKCLLPAVVKFKLP